MGLDFKFSSGVVIFSQFDTVFIFQVTICNDDLTEQSETFLLNASLVDSSLVNRAQVLPVTATVNIIDNDSKNYFISAL